MILHNFCFLFLNWQQVSNVSHDNQYIAKRKLKCNWIRLHRIIKQIYILTKIIYMDNGQLELCPRFVTIWGLSFQGPNNKNLLPIHTIQNIDYRPVLTLVLVLIKQYTYSYSCNNQVLGLTHITRTRTCTRTRKSGTRPSPADYAPPPPKLKKKRMQDLHG